MDRMTRGSFLRAGALSMFGMTHANLLRNAQGATGKAKACILLWLEGGISQLDSWDVKANSGFQTISTNVSGIRISEIFPKTAHHMDKLSIIRSMRTQERNHPQGTIETLCGHRPNPALKFPSVGSIVAKELGGRENMPPFVAVPMPTEGDFFNYEEAYSGGFLGPGYDSMILPDPSLPDFFVPDLSLPKSVTAEVIEDRRSLLKVVDAHYRTQEKSAEFAKMDTFQDQALRMILSPKVKEAFDISKEPEKIRDRYGRTRVGQSVLMARRLVQAGCRFVTASGYKHGEWDTHGNNETRLRDSLAPRLDQSLSALLEDLAATGLLQETVVLVTGEFGRTPTINPNRGRDHWPDCWSLLVGGGGIQGGHIVGASDERGAYVADRPISTGDLYATMYKAMGIDWTKTYMSPIGRPVYIANGFEDKAGEPIKEIC
ncbi:MAG: DUF1501 domain-containing protein [Acidobacteria bacterium]|nr:DUF1501 domain-containing protein [Acidobacteriota bacterium]